MPHRCRLAPPADPNVPVTIERNWVRTLQFDHWDRPSPPAECDGDWVAEGIGRAGWLRVCAPLAARPRNTERNASNPTGQAVISLTLDLASEPCVLEGRRPSLVALRRCRR